MIGLTISIGEKAGNIIHMPLKEDWHFHKTITQTNNLQVTYNGYQGYPINHWRYKDTIIIIEGIIFNWEDNELRSNLNRIVDNDYNNDDICNLIKDADGDFIVYIINEDKNSIFVFNDILGGLPLFYAQEGNTCFISREYSCIITNLKDKHWNSNNIAEFLKRGYNLRDRTFSQAVHKLEPASLIKVEFSNKIHLRCEQLYRDDFSLKDKYLSKEEAIKDLANLFIESCRRRVQYAIKHSYKIVNTMSGGFDSRTVAGGIEKFTSDYINVTYEYNRDESTIAKQVLHAINSKSEYIKLNFKNNPDLYDTRLTLNTDGRINAYTNSVCYHDMLCVRKHFGKQNILYFGGFGGEFLRHPLYETILPFDEIGLSFFPTLKLLSQVCNTSPRDLRAMFDATFKNRGENRESKYKDLYNENYQNLVRCSGEDRTRMFYFTVQPLMGKDFIMAIRHKVPLSWVGFSFYKNFLKEIDERLITVDIYGQSSNYLSNVNLRKIDCRKVLINKYLAPFKWLYNYCTDGMRANIIENTIDYRLIEQYLTYIDSLGLFNKNIISSNYNSLSKNFKYSLIGIITYISEVKCRTQKT